MFPGVRGNWLEFFKKIDWVTGENNDYRKWPKGFIWLRGLPWLTHS